MAMSDYPDLGTRAQYLRELATCWQMIEQFKRGEVEYIKEIERLSKDLAREEQEHNLCTTFHAIAVKERNHERVLAIAKDAEIEWLRQRMQIMRDYLLAYSSGSSTLWSDFLRVNPYAAEWFGAEQSQ